MRTTATRVTATCATAPPPSPTQPRSHTRRAQLETTDSSEKPPNSVDASSVGSRGYTPEADEWIVNYINKHGNQNSTWDALTKLFDGQRSEASLRSRWYSLVKGLAKEQTAQPAHPQPDMSVKPPNSIGAPAEGGRQGSFTWTPEASEWIVKYIDKHGNQRSSWDALTKLFDGQRSEASLRSHWYQLTKNKKAKKAAARPVKLRQQKDSGPAGKALPGVKTKQSDLIVSPCTACGGGVGSDQLTHPDLPGSLLLCDECHERVRRPFKRDEDGNEVCCRWCGYGGELMLCDRCPSSFCKGCLSRNIGAAELSALEKTKDSWECLRCNPSQVQSKKLVFSTAKSDGEQAQLDDPPPGKDEDEQAEDQDDDLADLRSLPLDGWTVHHDSEHDEDFWWHAATQRSSWTHPATGLFPDGSSHENPKVAELAQQRQRELSRKSDRGGGGGGAAAAAHVRTKRPQAAQGSAPIRTKRPIAKVDGSATAAPIRTKRPMPQVGRDPFGRGGARPRHARPFGGRGQKANQSAAPPVQTAKTGKENAFEECPHCPPGSGKPRGHPGRHIGQWRGGIRAEARVGGTQSAKREGAGKPPPPKRRREDEQDSSSEPPIDKGTVRRAPPTDHDATQLVGTRIEYNLSRVWQGGVVASAIKKEGCEGWMNVVRQTDLWRCPPH